jgi:lipopolysaccharide biosynthesis glycosyltransferase
MSKEKSIKIDSSPQGMMVSVVFASDDNYAFFLGTALCSLFENKKGDYQISIFVIDGGITTENKRNLSILEERYSFRITYVVPDAKLFRGFPTDIWPIAAYYRIVIAQLLPPNIEKVIYLDCDLIIRGDIQELFLCGLDSHAIGAAVSNPDYTMDQFGVSEKGLCFNSGVLVINTTLWRKGGIEKKLLDFINKNAHKLRFPDNDTLNMILSGNYRRLSDKYNFIPLVTRPSGENPLVVHFAGEKPWYRFSELPYQKDYLKYLDKTPWRKQKFRRFMDVPFAEKIHIYPVAWWGWNLFKRTKRLLISNKGTRKLP